MRNLILAGTLAAFGTLAATPALAQQSRASTNPAPAAAPPTAAAPVQVGLGIGFVPYSQIASDRVGGVTPFDILVPIQAGSLRLEPSLGLYRYRQDGWGHSLTVEAGLGAFLTSRVSSSVGAYAGPRLAASYASMGTTDGRASASATGLRAAGALGVEYWASPRFALGFEAQLGFSRSGTIARDGTIWRAGWNAFYSAGEIFVRAYPW